jgi:AbiV family abortive infection protein
VRCQMNRKEAYKKAMVESIKNSGMWLKEAKTIAKKGSESHAQALVILSGEELGKAIMCWLTINGVFPYNHWEVDFKNKDSIFRKHDLKNATVIGFSSALISPEDIPEDSEEMVTDTWTGEPIEFRKYLGKLGAFAAKVREAWMYVDIEQEEKGVLKVSSPLERKPTSVFGAITDMTHSLQSFKNFVRAAKEHHREFSEIFKELRLELEEKDEKFPEHPQWIRDLTKELF